MTDIVSSADDTSLDPEALRLFAELGARPVINAAGAYTMLAGGVVQR